MIQQFIVTDYKQYYLDMWKEMLGEFLGWSESQVMQWAQEKGIIVFLEDPDDIFYHQTPQYWITHLLVPDELKARLSNLELIDLEGRIVEAFKDEHFYHFPTGTDWRPFRAKIERILGEYGARLPDPARA